MRARAKVLIRDVRQPLPGSGKAERAWQGKVQCLVWDKISLSVIGDSLLFLERLSYASYNEREDLKAQTRVDRRSNGRYQKVIHADRVYGARANRSFCLHHGIRLSGPLLRHSMIDKELLACDTHQYVDDHRQRNAVEEKNDHGERRED